jgi:hypothetical protein
MENSVHLNNSFNSKHCLFRILIQSITTSISLSLTHTTTNHTEHATTTFINPTNSSIYLRLIHSLSSSLWKNPVEVKLVPLSNPGTFYFVSSFKSPSFHRILFSLAQTLRRVGRSSVNLALSKYIVLP